MTLLGIVESRGDRPLWRSTHMKTEPQPVKSSEGTEGQRVVRDAGVVGVAVLASRVLGLVRESVFAAMFGAGTFLDALVAAFQIPNLLRDLFAEGALSTAFTTTFAKTRSQEGPQQASLLAHLVLSSVLLVGTMICFIGILATPAIVHVTNFGFHQVPGKFELTVRLTRILFPFLLLVSLASVIMGMLNAQMVFGIPASASSAFNVVSVAAGVMLAYLWEAPPDWRHPQFTSRALYGVSFGVLLGGAAQLGIQLPSLWRTGYRWRWRLDFRHPGLRQVWALMWPSVMAGAAVQVNVLVNGMFASQIDGARSWLYCAFRLMQFPIGLFGVAIATVTLPRVACLHARADLEAFGRTVQQALRLALFLTLPAAAGLFALAPTIIGVIYEHGRFTPRDTALTAAALRAYSMGLPGYAAIKVLVPCFYALHLPRTPLKVSLIGVSLNLGLNFLLVKGLAWGHVGLATTTGCLAIINCLQLIVNLRRRVPLGSASRWPRWMVLVTAGSVLCAASAWAVTQAILSRGGSTLPLRLMALTAGGIIGVTVYAGWTAAWRFPEIAMFTRTILRGAHRGRRRL